MALVPYRDYIFWALLASEYRAILWWHISKDGATFQPYLQPVGPETWRQIQQ